MAHDHHEEKCHCEDGCKGACAGRICIAEMSMHIKWDGCHYPGDALLLAAFHRLNVFIKNDPDLRCAYTELEIGGEGSD